MHSSCRLFVLSPDIMSPEVTSSNYHFLISIRMYKDSGALQNVNRTQQKVVSRICFSLHRFTWQETLEFSHDSPSTLHVEYPETTKQLLAHVISLKHVHPRLGWHLFRNKLSGSCITENTHVTLMSVVTISPTF
jgi:hypothetical protein